MLKALAYKQLCHYASAKASAREFLRRYGSSLTEVRRSREPLTDPVIRTAAVQRRRPRRIFAFLNSLQREREGIERFSDEHGLARHLGRVYELKIAEVNRDLDRVVDENWDPPVTMGARLTSILNDDLQHAGQAAYVRGILLAD